MPFDLINEDHLEDAKYYRLKNVTSLMTTKFPYIFVLSFLLFTSFLTPANAFQTPGQNFKVVLDAGHGGHDPGNLGNGYKEKNIALNIVLEIGAELEKHKDIEVIYTRKTDVFIELRQRAKIANDADADLFVSVHCNSHNSSASGTETFVLGVTNVKRNMDVAKKENEVIFLESDYEKHYEGFNPDSPQSLIGLSLLQEDYTDQSIQLARMIEDSFVNKLNRKSRGVKQASLWVMHNTYMPSVLVEVGFLTYKPEGQYLNSNKGQGDMAQAIEKAILNYKALLEQNVGENIYSQKVISEEVLQEHLVDGVIFKVQIAASSRDLEAKPFNFNGLEDLSREKDGDLYKYFSGNTSDYNKILTQQDLAKKKGYPSSFIVAYKDGQRISLDEALKSTSN